MPNRCLYIESFKEFLKQKPQEVLGTLHNNYHGDSLTTTNDAWMGEIDIMQQVLQPWKDENAQIIFEYDIPHLGKRIDMALLLRNNFAAGKGVESDVRQVQRCLACFSGATWQILPASGCAQDSAGVKS